MEPNQQDLNTLLEKASKGLYPTDEPSFLFDYAKERLFGGGKKYRPALVMEACRSVGGNPTITVLFALAIESMHAGYLDIDDVLDGSRKRRGEDTTYIKLEKKLGKNQGIPQALMVGMYNGDALPWGCLQKGAEIWDHETLKYLSGLMYKIKFETVKGESLDILYRVPRAKKLTPEMAIEIYQKKTGAYTVGGPIAGGMRIGGGAPEICDKAYVIGRNFLGPAFQAIDDVLNLRPTEKYGKEFADDIGLESKPTLIVALFNKRANEKDRIKFHKKFGVKLTKGERSELIELLDKYGVIDDTKKFAEENAELGKRGLERIIPLTESSKGLYELIDFGIKRTW